MHFQYPLRLHIATLNCLGCSDFLLRIPIIFMALITELHRFEYLVHNALFLISSVICIVQFCRI